MIQGTCLCKAVHITVEKSLESFGACHCGMCRTWGGGPFFSTDCGQNVTFTGEENITLYDSSHWAERGFCKKCGTHLFYRMKESKQYFMSIGIFKNHNFSFDHQIFIDEKPEYYHFSNTTTMMTGPELFAKYAQ